jgi:hypothetical protein
MTKDINEELNKAKLAKAKEEMDVLLDKHGVALEAVLNYSKLGVFPTINLVIKE